MVEQGGRGAMMTGVCVTGTIEWMTELNGAKEVQCPICSRGSNTNGWSHVET